MHCGPDSTKMHFLLTAWHAGHDVARAHGGSNDEQNLSPLHARCNQDQGTETFDEYNKCW
jgi:5-methylcytosine-specific restriction endonuclease McrA